MIADVFIGLINIVCERISMNQSLVTQNLH